MDWSPTLADHLRHGSRCRLTGRWRKRLANVQRPRKLDHMQSGFRGFIEELVEAELDDMLGRSRYQRPGTADTLHHTAGRERQLLGSFGPMTISVP